MAKSKSIFDEKPDRVKQFLASSKGATETEKRDMEAKMLKPEVLVKNTEPEPKHKSDLAGRKVLIVFRDKTQMELIGNLFEIRESKVNKDVYITNIQLLETIAQDVKDGVLGIVNGQIQVLGSEPVGDNEVDELTDAEVTELEKVLELEKVDPEAVVDLEPEVLETAKELVAKKKGTKKPNTYKIRAAEIEYKKNVNSVEKLNKLVKKMYLKPWKYADVGKGESGFYDFLKYLYIIKPDGTEVSLVSYYDEIVKK